ncbi:MAG: peptide chain release factor N(5)-glutamine methyltransferase [Planctomycetota bacterium]|jgi:release factor glutamine methyltransferase
MSDQTSAPWTVLRLLNWTQEYFGNAHLDSPRLCAEMLLAHVLGCQRIELYARFDQVPPQEKLTEYRELVRRAAGYEPVAYLVGEKEFYSLRFRVTADVLIPRPETEILVAEAVDHLKALGRPGLMWDVCTGSGCVAVAAAKQFDNLTVLATDVSEAAVVIAAENAAAHGLGERVHCRQADLLAVPADREDLSGFDVITANPPYVADGEEVAESVRHEPVGALRAGADGLDVIRPLIAAAPEYLAAGGALILEFGCGQADAVRDLIVAAGRFDEPRILKDHQGIERTAVAVLR